MLPDRVSNAGPLSQGPYRLRYAAQLKSWTTDLAVLGLSHTWAVIVSTNVIPLHIAFHYHLPTVLI